MADVDRAVAERRQQDDGGRGAALGVGADGHLFGPVVEVFEPLLDAVQPQRRERLVEVHFERDHLRRQLDDLLVVGCRGAHEDAVVAARPLLGQLYQRDDPWPMRQRGSHDDRVYARL